MAQALSPSRCSVMGCQQSANDCWTCVCTCAWGTLQCMGSVCVRARAEMKSAVHTCGCQMKPSEIGDLPQKLFLPCSFFSLSLFVFVVTFPVECARVCIFLYIYNIYIYTHSHDAVP